MCKEQMELLEFINQISFMLDDIALYLDTHPKCQKALETYGYYRKLRHDAIKDYSKMYTPLNKYNVNNENYFDWVDSPWPWEGACNC